jgi:hypothetical protein
MLQQVHLAMSGIWTLIVIGAVCTGSCKSNYHSITTYLKKICCKRSRIFFNYTWRSRDSMSNIMYTRQLTLDTTSIIK